MLDLVITGGGIAGITAAVYAKRAGFENYKFFEKGLPGGQIQFIDKIDNFPGVALGTSGAEFSASLQKQLKELDITIEQAEITDILRSRDSGYILKTASGREYFSKAVICASGAVPRTLGIESEKDFMGKGVSYCAVCDGFFFRNKTVAVIGGGNAALEEALYLANLASKVYVVHRRDKFRGFDYIGEQVKNRDNIEIRWNSVVESVTGDSLLRKMILKSTQNSTLEEIDIDGMFVAIGYTPNTSFMKNVLDIDNTGFISVNHNMSTASPGIFACGDCIKKDLKQLVTSASEGAVAAMSAYSYIQGP